MSYDSKLSTTDSVTARTRTTLPAAIIPTDCAILSPVRRNDDNPSTASTTTKRRRRRRLVPIQISSPSKSKEPRIRRSKRLRRKEKKRKRMEEKQRKKEEYATLRRSKRLKQREKMERKEKRQKKRARRVSREQRDENDKDTAAISIADHDLDHMKDSQSSSETKGVIRDRNGLYRDRKGRFTSNQRYSVMPVIPAPTSCNTSHLCTECGKLFKSKHALGGHKAWCARLMFKKPMSNGKRSRKIYEESDYVDNTNGESVKGNGEEIRTKRRRLNDDVEDNGMEQNAERITNQVMTTLFGEKHHVEDVALTNKTIDAVNRRLERALFGMEIQDSFG